MTRTMPEMMRRSLESFLLQMTEPLDPLEALKITNMTLNLMETVYVMGKQDSHSDHRLARLQESP
jgi:hypothetical protein